MVSTKAGSAICNCDNPDDCTHKVDITLGNKTISYKQSWFPQYFYYVLDSPLTTFEYINELPKEEKPNVTIELSSVSKGCISHNPDCPVGNLFDEKYQPVTPFSPKKPYKGKLFYHKTNQDFSEIEQGPFSVLARFLKKDFHSYIEKQHYPIRVDECAGKPLITKEYSGIEKVMSTLFGEKTVLNSNIYLVTKEKQEIDLIFKAQKDVEEFTDQQRKKQQTKTNRENGLGHRKHRGWTQNTTRYQATNALIVEGKIKLQKGAASRTWSHTLQKEFKKNKNEIGPIESFVQGIDKITNVLSVGHDSDKFKILKMNLIYPSIKIHGEHELAHNNKFQLYSKFGAEIAAAPLIGLELRVDVLQIVAAYFKIERALSSLREAGQLYEEKVKKGENGAYAGAQLDLILTGELNVKFGWASDDKGDWSFKKDSLLEAGFAIKAETNIRGGVSYYAVYGYVDTTAKAEAKLLVALESKPKSLDLVFYHDGIKAMVDLSFAFGMGKEKSRSGGFKSTTNIERKKGVGNEWVFQKPLPKDKSPYRVSLG
ncbi:hypothetical protein L7G72_01855 [Xenorhabdus bovienii]|uniref:hypothetical protein n=1 Tax=Xenorhabdus bovienii TaxID=40576 RepID=UPI001EE1046F|nr:hypothetical protein [Xenorhabdus bovienii]MCG3460621.1 hypothetical protein [Xenorhabdus bovienii]